MGAYGWYAVFGVVTLALLGRTGSTPVPTEKLIPLAPFEMSTVELFEAGTPGGRTRTGGGGDSLILPSMSEELSRASLRQKRSTKLHASLMQPLVAGLPEDREGVRGGTDWVVLPSTLHKISSRSVPNKMATPAPRQPDNRRNIPRVPGAGTGVRGSGNTQIPKKSHIVGTISGPDVDPGSRETTCEVGHKWIRGQCRRVLEM